MLYPIITKTRDLLDLSGIWELQFENKDEKYLIAVPGSFNDQMACFEEKHFIGNMDYKRKFVVSQVMLNKRIFLHFGSATHVAEVYVNGQLAFQHKGGFTPFAFEITSLVHVGNNDLLVKLSNVLDYTSLPVGTYREKVKKDGTVQKSVNENFDFFNYAGIHRPVKLWLKPKNFIEDIAIHYDLRKDDSATVHFDIEVNGTAQEIKISIYDEEDQLVAESQGGFVQQLEVKKVRRWQPLNAYLYKARVELLNEGKMEDVYTEEFGMRTVEVKNNQFLINDKPFYFKGFGRHEDTDLHGRGLDEVANVADMNRMKWIGANSFRTSHYPYAEEMMRLADREGFVVIDETTAVGLMEEFGANLDLSGHSRANTWEVMKTTEAHEQVIRELIKRDKNYACVVMWSIANEPRSDEEGAYEYFKPLFELARSLDPQKRPCTFVNILFASPDKCLVSSLCDVICLNRYYGWYIDMSNYEMAYKNMLAELELWHQTYPDKPVMFTEYGCDTLAGLHDIDERTPFTEENQLEYYKMNEAIFDALPFFVGEQTWNYADFQTKFGLFRIQGNKKGIFTRQRHPKMIAHHLRERWTNIPDFDYKTSPLI